MKSSLRYRYALYPHRCRCDDRFRLPFTGCHCNALCGKEFRRPNGSDRNLQLRRHFYSCPFWEWRKGRRMRWMTLKAEIFAGPISRCRRKVFKPVKTVRWTDLINHSFRRLRFKFTTSWRNGVIVKAQSTCYTKPLSYSQHVVRAQTSWHGTRRKSTAKANAVDLVLRLTVLWRHKFWDPRLARKSLYLFWRELSSSRWKRSFCCIEWPSECREQKNSLFLWTSHFFVLFG